MPILGIDRSHYNAPPNYAQFKAAGGAFVIAKATEGTGWSDPSFAACRAGTEAAGLVFGSYHFARWGDPVAEARYYLSVATPRAGELVALDDEAAFPPGLDVVAWTLAFCSTVHGVTGAWPFVYMNQSWLSSHNWAQVAANDGLWLAMYDGQPTGGPVGQFPVLAMKQFTDRGTVAGQPGTVDVDEFQGDLAALLRYAVPGVNPPTPEADLTPEEHTMLADIRVYLGAANASAMNWTGEQSVGYKVNQILAAVQAASNPQQLIDDIVAAIKALPAPAAQEVIAGVLAGLNGAQLSVTQPAAS